MPKHGGKQVARKPQARKGEGVPVHVSSSNPTSFLGLPSRAISVDLSSAPVPERKYFAEVCTVTMLEHSARIMFGQPQFGVKRLRTLVMVAMSRRSVIALLSSLDQMQSPSLEEICAAEGLAPEISPPIEEEPVQVVELSANFTLCGVSSTEACVDFFEASPFSLGVAVQSDTLHVDPVVRVSLTTPLLLGMVMELRKGATNWLGRDKQGEQK